MGKQFQSLYGRQGREAIAPMERREHREETIERLESGLRRLEEEVSFQKDGIAEAMTEQDPLKRQEKLKEWEAWGTELRTAIAYLRTNVTDLPLDDRENYNKRFDDLWREVRATRRPETPSAPTTKIHSRRK